MAPKTFLGMAITNLTAKVGLHKYSVSHKHVS